MLRRLDIMPAKVLHGMDRDVYQIIRKFEDELDRDTNKNKQPKFTVAGVYDSIKRSNSSLARQKKRPLEDSIERVLRLRKEERKEEDEEEALEEVPDGSPKPKVNHLPLILVIKQVSSRADTSTGTRLLCNEQTHYQVLEHTKESVGSFT